MHAVPQTQDYFLELDNLRNRVADTLQISPSLQYKAQRVRDCYHPLAHSFTNKHTSYCHEYRLCPPCARDKARHLRDSLLGRLQTAQNKTDKKLEYYMGSFTLLDTPVGGLKSATHSLRSGIWQLFKDSDKYPGWSMSIETARAPTAGMYNHHAHVAFLTAGHGGRGHRSQKEWAKCWNDAVPKYDRSIKIDHFRPENDSLKRLAAYTVMNSAVDWLSTFNQDLSDPNEFLEKYIQLKGEILHLNQGLLGPSTDRIQLPMAA